MSGRVIVPEGRGQLAAVALPHRRQRFVGIFLVHPGEARAGGEDLRQQCSAARLDAPAVQLVDVHVLVLRESAHRVAGGDDPDPVGERGPEPERLEGVPAMVEAYAEVGAEARLGGEAGVPALIAGPFGGHAVKEALDEIRAAEASADGTDEGDLVGQGVERVECPGHRAVGARDRRARQIRRGTGLGVIVLVAGAEDDIQAGGDLHVTLGKEPEGAEARVGKVRRAVDLDHRRAEAGDRGGVVVGVGGPIPEVVGAVGHQGPHPDELRGFQAAADGADVGVVAGVEIALGAGAEGDGDVLVQVTLVPLGVEARVHPIEEGEAEGATDVACGAAGDALAGVEDLDPGAATDVGGVDEAEAGVVGGVRGALEEESMPGAQFIPGGRGEVPVADAAVEHRFTPTERHVTEAAGGGVVGIRRARGAVDPEDRPAEPAGEGGAGAALIAVAGIGIPEGAVDRAGGFPPRESGADQVHHPADRVRSVQHRARPADHLDPVETAAVDQRRKLAEVLLATAVVEPESILEEEDPLSPLTADDGAFLVRSDASEVQPGEVAHELDRGAVGALAEGGAIDQGHRLGHPGEGDG